jgi:hypothetical protein
MHSGSGHQHRLLHGLGERRGPDRQGHGRRLHIHGHGDDADADGVRATASATYTVTQARTLTVPVLTAVGETARSWREPGHRHKKGKTSAAHTLRFRIVG